MPKVEIACEAHSLTQLTTIARKIAHTSNHLEKQSGGRHFAKFAVFVVMRTYNAFDQYEYGTRFAIHYQQLKMVSLNFYGVYIA